MNDVYFACKTHKAYVDAGYRWAYWALEDKGVVKRNNSFQPNQILSAASYWESNGDEDGSDYLKEEVFPSVKEFLQTHRNCSLVYGESDYFLPAGDEERMDWLQTGYCAKYSPRLFAEHLGLKTWSQVEAYLDQQELQAPWMRMGPCGAEKYEQMFRSKFEKLVAGPRAG